jgi:hypothetical protein
VFFRASYFAFREIKPGGMMKQGHEWIVTDEIASLLDSVDSSITYNMRLILLLEYNLQNEIQGRWNGITKHMTVINTKSAKHAIKVSNMIHYSL